MKKLIKILLLVVGVWYNDGTNYYFVGPCINGFYNVKTYCYDSSTGLYYYCGNQYIAC